MSARGADRQRLAYRVKPRRSECFNSWISRLLEKHSISLVQLIAHLECHPDLAKCDLAFGKRSIPSDLHEEFDTLLKELAWSIDRPKRTILQTMYRANRHDVLPLAAQTYGCPKCWSNALSRGEPLSIRKEWTYRASFWCHLHKLPLQDRKSIDTRLSQASKIRRCEVLAEKLASWRDGLRIDPALMRLNQEYLSIVAAAPGEPQGFSRHAVGYRAAFGRNDYHFTRARIALLLLAHANKPFQANRFDHFLSQDRRKLLSGRRYRFVGNRRPIFARRVIEMPKVKAVTRWASTDDLPFVYSQIWRRQNSEASSLASEIDGQTRGALGPDKESYRKTRSTALWAGS